MKLATTYEGKDHEIATLTQRYQFLNVIFLPPLFLGATKHLYSWLCPSVGRLVGRSLGRLVGNAFVRRSTRRTLLAFLAWLFKSSSSTFEI